MPTTDQDARALTHLACRIRAETPGAGKWDEAGTHSVIAGLIGQHLATTIERVVRHAADPTAKTPGAIRRPFVPEAPHEVKRNPKPGECCTDCGQWMHAPNPACPQPTTRPPTRDPESHVAGVARLRAALTPMSEED